jgi:hypothetical protein
MKYNIKKLKKDDPIFKQRFTVSSHKKNLQEYIEYREKTENKKNLFLEPIADQNTSTEEIYQRLVNILIKNGWKIKEDK